MRHSRLGVHVLALSLVVGTTYVGCPCTDSLLNASPALQWAAFSRFGASRVCEEVTKRGVLLSVDVPMPGFPPASGRFFPQTCQSALNDDRRTLSLWITGNGYAWTPATQKLAYESEFSVEYGARLHKDGGTIYVWFEPASPPPLPKVRITYVEQQPTGVLLRLPSAESFANSLAAGFAASQLDRGFTVIHDGSGDDFGLGQIPLGRRPVHPFNVSGSERYQLANESFVIHGQQQEFLGPFEVDHDDRALFVHVQVDGPAMELLLVSKDVGSQWRTEYARTSPPPPPPGWAPIFRHVQTPAHGSFHGWFPVKKGSYFLVLDNSASAGRVAPPAKIPTPIDPSVALGGSARILVELADAP